MLTNSYSLLIQSKKKTNFNKSIYSEGKSNTCMFRHFKSRKSVMHKISLLNNDMCTNSEALIKMFSEHHKSVMSTPVMPLDSFPDFENFFTIQIDDIFHQKYVISDKITTAELDHSLKSMSAVSALGPSGQCKPLFKFFLAKFPNFFTKLINEIVNCDISKTSVAYLNHRRIIFIPKKGKNSAKLLTTIRFHFLSFCTKSFQRR